MRRENSTKMYKTKRQTRNPPDNQKKLTLKS